VTPFKFLPASYVKLELMMVGLFSTLGKMTLGRRLGVSTTEEEGEAEVSAATPTSTKSPEMSSLFFKSMHAKLIRRILRIGHSIDRHSDQYVTARNRSNRTNEQISR
jgi:protein gp37